MKPGPSEQQNCMNETIVVVKIMGHMLAAHFCLASRTKHLSHASVDTPAMSQGAEMEPFRGTYLGWVPH